MRISGRSLSSSTRNGLPESPGYVYRGIPGWNPAAALTAAKPKVWQPPAPHGTLAGFQRHKRNHETPCDPCRDASNAYKRAWKRKAAKPS